MIRLTKAGAVLTYIIGFAGVVVAGIWTKYEDEGPKASDARNTEMVAK